MSQPFARDQADVPPHPVPAGPSTSGETGRVAPGVCIQQIHTIVACENYTEVVLARHERILVRRTMAKWAALLPAAQFPRVHRGLFVNLARIGRVERGAQQGTRLHFTGDGLEPLEVKRRHWPALRARLDTWRTLARSPALDEKSIAVLPFANLSDDPANEIFCDGVSEELLNVLARIPGLRVAARTSSFYFKGRPLPIATIAQQLGVRFVVEGSVRQQGRRVRITAQLISAADGFHLWSDNFDRDLTDIFSVQEGIAALVATNLQLKLGGTAPPAVPVDPAAHGLALAGRHYWSLRTAEGFARAETSFRSALDRAPRLAAAHAGLANVYVVRAMYRLADGARGAPEDLQRARSEAQQALACDPAQAEPHAALGFARFHEGALDDAEPHFQRAFALNPNYATGYQFYAWTLAARGLLERGLTEYARAVALDPLSFINIDRQAAMLALAGRHPEALAANLRAAALRTEVLAGNLSQRAIILLALGRCEEALAAARDVRRLFRDQPFRRNSDTDALFVLHRTGRPREAAGYAAELLAQYPQDNYLRGFALGAVGRFDDAWDSLAFTPAIMLPQLYWSPLWEGVRRRREFAALLARLGRSGEYRRARLVPRGIHAAEPRLTFPASSAPC